MIQAEPPNLSLAIPRLSRRQYSTFRVPDRLRFVFGGGTALVIDVGRADTEVADLFAGIDGSTVSFTFTSATNPIHLFPMF